MLEGTEEGESLVRTEQNSKKMSLNLEFITERIHM
jgi:hypothetical protein